MIGVSLNNMREILICFRNLAILQPNRFFMTNMLNILCVLGYHVDKNAKKLTICYYHIDLVRPADLVLTGH